MGEIQRVLKKKIALVSGLYHASVWKQSCILTPPADPSLATQ